jgi:hypothetical protein
VLVAAAQPRQTLDPLLRVPHFQVLRVQPHLDLLADQPARHHVAVPLHVNHASLVYATLQASARFQTPRRQRTQHRQLLGETLPPTRVEPLLERLQKLRVLVATAEISAATQHQRLIHSLLETAMPLLDVAVLVRMVRLNLLPNESIMPEQPLVALPELLALGGIVHRQAHPIGPVSRRHAAQFPQRVLQPLAEALETLRETDRRRLPVRVGQHEVIDQVRKRLSLDRHPEVVHGREVRRRQPARLMHLGEEHLLGRPRRGPPAPHLPLQRSQLPVGEPPRVAALQLAEDCLGLEPRLFLQQRADLRPDFGERIDPGLPVMGPGQLAGQLLQPPIFACRLVVHVGPRRRHGQRFASRQQPPQFAYLPVSDHRKPPCMKNLRIV